MEGIIISVSKMKKKIYLDSANLKEIEELGETGLIQGVTTNPSLIAKEPKDDFNKLINKIALYCNRKDLSLSVEVFTNEPSRNYYSSIRAMEYFNRNY